jgi:CheY-like chemotaxis protein
MPHAILIADDNQQFRRALATILEEMGYSVSEASNGSEALRDLDSLSRFCLLITDLAMPDMDGTKLTMSLRKCRPTLPIVAVSGTFEGQFLRVARLLGVRETLQKPFKRMTILKAVKSALPKKVITAAACH